jgi:hypothetical protein
VQRLGGCRQSVRSVSLAYTPTTCWLSEAGIIRATPASERLLTGMGQERPFSGARVTSAFPPDSDKIVPGRQQTATFITHCAARSTCLNAVSIAFDNIGTVVYQPSGHRVFTKLIDGGHYPAKYAHFRTPREITVGEEEESMPTVDRRARLKRTCGVKPASCRGMGL